MKTYTYEEIKEVLETAKAKCIKKVDEGSSLIAEYMDKSFNNGVQLMMLEASYQLLQMETGKKVSA